MRAADTKFSTGWVWVGAGALLMIAPLARGMSEKDYKNALKLAEAKVLRTRNASAASALSSPIIRAYFGRYYRVGDSWDVASWEVKNPMMSMTPIPENPVTKTGHGGVFHYEVKEVRSGVTPEVVIAVTQLSDLGMTPVDPKVAELTLTMSDRYVQTEKSYRMRGQADAVRVSPHGIHTRVTLLEIYALDVPEIETAERNTPSALPDLPSAVQAIASRTSYHPDLSRSTWLEQDDFFGRPVQLLWQYGDPWPAYLKTSTGMSILIRSNTGSPS